jgi:hypothetical protein
MWFAAIYRRARRADLPNLQVSNASQGLAGLIPHDNINSPLI